MNPSMTGKPVRGGAKCSTGQAPIAKKKKLKASCDFCAISKVKCDRGQPQCRRCVRSELTCPYSESRRVGKARLMYSMNSTSSNDSSPAMDDNFNPRSDGENCTTGASAAAAPTTPYLESTNWPDPMALDFLYERSTNSVSGTLRPAIYSRSTMSAFEVSLNQLVVPSSTNMLSHGPI
ncbi:hypothetical protein BKA67DRAFT_279309 [Truncatella angustata]|uniref:Zn(2)-C6 fungal-type domain-containing protein n=1 Tax=Truncatella angustata TaxID=152316 RepID=A0A9P8ULR8_9PEZI|nr:uncharacterized protein BKA67DRAFT_279309 [Truncatella angustata]KAH6654443.1 hypothetical protein BKA67DRAFT_279309 [Truncatella angustata]